MAKKNEPPVEETPPPAIPPQEQYDFSNEARAGLENVKAGDLSIPFLVILQDLSPQIKKTHKDYLTKGIQGAEPGQVINSVTNQVLITVPGGPATQLGAPGSTLDFIPCMFQKMYVEWTPREKGGGIVTSHLDSAILQRCTKDDRGRDVLPNGNLIVTTAYFFGVTLIDGEPTRCVIGLSSTQLKKSRTWLNIATSIRFTASDGSRYNPPLFSHIYSLSTVPESNEQGSWYGWRVTLKGPVKDVELIDEGRTIAKDLRTAPPLSLNAPATDDADNPIG